MRLLVEGVILTPSWAGKAAEIAGLRARDKYGVYSTLLPELSRNDISRCAVPAYGRQHMLRKITVRLTKVRGLGRWPAPTGLSWSQTLSLIHI